MLRHQKPSQMIAHTYAGMAHIDLGGIGLGIGHQFRGVIHGHGRMHRQDIGRVDEHRHRRQIPLQVEGKARVERWRSGKGGDINDQHGVTIGC